MLIKLAEGEEFEEFVKEYEDFVSTWFYDIRGWTPGMVPKEREAWIRCQDVPIHARSNQFFEMIVGSLAHFMSLDYSTMHGKRFDVARVLLRTTSWETIHSIVKVRINGQFFNIRLIEEPFPEFVFSQKKIKSKGR